MIHKGQNFRVSIPFFFEPNFEAVIKVRALNAIFFPTFKEQRCISTMSSTDLV